MGGGCFGTAVLGFPGVKKLPCMCYALLALEFCSVTNASFMNKKTRRCIFIKYGLFHSHISLRIIYEVHQALRGVWSVRESRLGQSRTPCIDLRMCAK